MPHKDPEARRKWKREYSQRPHAKAKKAAYQKKYGKEYRGRPEVKERHAAYERRWRHGLSEADIAALGGACAACGSTAGDKTLTIDHDHKTGKVRGLLCQGCNLALGFLKDSPERIFLLLKYLQRFEKEA